jgi:hypothetical protein
MNIKNKIQKIGFFSYKNISVGHPDPGFGVFLKPGSGMGKK